MLVVRLKPRTPEFENRPPETAWRDVGDEEAMLGRPCSVLVDDVGRARD